MAEFQPLALIQVDLPPVLSNSRSNARRSAADVAV